MNRFLGLCAMAAVLVCSAAQTNAGDPADPAVPKEKTKVVRQLTDADNATTVKLAVGSSFDIALKGNATTGYQWKVVKIGGDAVAQKGEMEYIVDRHRRRMVGVGGTCVFHFEVKKAGIAKIELGYVRPWEKNTPPVKTFSVTIDSGK